MVDVTSSSPPLSRLISDSVTSPGTADAAIKLTGLETVQQLELLYSDVCQQQKVVENRLATFISEDLKTETELLRLLAELGGLHVLETDCKELGSALEFSANLGDKVTRQIKSLDNVRLRVASCLQRVEDIIDLKLCTDGVQQALQNEEFEQAAAHIHRFLKLDAEVLRMSAAAAVSDEDQPAMSPTPSAFNDSAFIGANDSSLTTSPPTSPTPSANPSGVSSLEASLKLLKEAEMKLKSIVRRQFDDAVRKNDVASVERFFKIFPLLKLNKEGLERFSRYLANQMAQNCHSLTQRIVDIGQENPRYNVRFADAASMMLEEVARVIDVHRPLVETYYGPGNILDFIKVLQKECDDKFKDLVDEFRQKRRFNFIFSQVEALNKQSVKKSFAVIEKPDTKSLDVILAEISLINVKVEQYVSFVKRRLDSDIEAAVSSPTELESGKKDANRYVMTTGLVVCTQEMLGQYVSLEEYLMREMVSKAIGIDTIDEGQLMSTVVDDVFFVIKKSLHRAICSSTIDIVCAMINHAYSLLDDQYIPVLRNRLRSASAGVIGPGFDLAQAYSFVQSAIQRTHPSSASLSALASSGQSSGGSTGASTGTGPGDMASELVIDTRQLFAWCVALNNVDISADYVSKLRANVEEEIAKIFISLSEQSRGKLDMVLSVLDSVRDKLREMQTAGANTFTHSAIRPKLKPGIERFANTDHNIREEEYASYEADDPWCQNFIRQIDQILHAIKPLLTPENHDQIVKGVVQEAASLLERSVVKMHYSKLGGMQLDKDIRKLVTYLTSITSWSIRDRFARLTQISTILSLEREAEFAEFLQTDASYAWRLTPTEIRQVMMLRVDFSAENVKKLKL